MSDQPLSASNKEKFEYLSSALRTYYDGVIDFEFKHEALLMIILGWLITVESAQKLFATSVTARVCATLAIVILSAFHGLWVLKYYEKSATAYWQLVDLNYMPKEYYMKQKLQPYLYISFVAMHVSIALFICILVWLS